MFMTLGLTLAMSCGDSEGDNNANNANNTPNNAANNTPNNAAGSAITVNLSFDPPPDNQLKLFLTLFEFDPNLADVAADPVESREKAVDGDDLQEVFEVNLRADRRYYFSASGSANLDETDPDASACGDYDVTTAPLFFGGDEAPETVDILLEFIESRCE